MAVSLVVTRCECSFSIKLVMLKLNGIDNLACAHKCISDLANANMTCFPP